MDKHTLDTPYPVGPVHFYTCELKGDIIMFDTGPYTFLALDYVKKKHKFKQVKVCLYNTLARGPLRS